MRLIHVLIVAVPKDIDLKSLVYEAYQKGAQELLYVVPFTAKVLESCAKSKVSFRWNCSKQNLFLMCYARKGWLQEQLHSSLVKVF